MSDFRDFFNQDQIKDLVTRSSAYENERHGGSEGSADFQNIDTADMANSDNTQTLLHRGRPPSIDCSDAMGNATLRSPRGPIVTREPDEKYRDQAGLLTIGRRGNWIYTKELFVRRDIVDVVNELIA